MAAACLARSTPRSISRPWRTPAPPAPEAAAGSHATLEGLARFRGGRPEQAQGRARCPGGPRSRTRSAMCKPIELPKPPPPPPPGGQGATAGPPPPPHSRPRCRSGAAATNRPPPGQLPATGRAIWAARALPATGTIWVKGQGLWQDQLQPVCEARRHRVDVSWPEHRRHRVAAQRTRRLRLRLEPVAGDYSVDVIVTGEMWGTRWTYAMVSPR